MFTALLFCASEEAIDTFIAHCDVAASDLLMPTFWRAIRYQRGSWVRGEHPKIPLGLLHSRNLLFDPKR
ncbi:hypothetical protein [Bradyrhizobium sp. AUGA SZCCT0042]|uniref:hypothetical protein n=1 Tax=Bradyrhizobium sp. AUGA SZCCT0042 TaxID=2807651 RepID=UPI001BA578C3|nr:hypothetical protein [Bradyrhizobium sp. AUGA SZCCT0042]MBR1302161.1 hypothetical protein [Bradyrhizobium sp. AUGA SZCCT0042]